ncbi:MAG: nitrilase-related carbon-nitrogen hydrolase, partial [Solirubrobacterales bacterium]
MTSVLLAQLAPTPRDIEANVGRAARIVADNPGAELAVFPELYVGGYDLAAVAEGAVDPFGPELEPLRQAAREAGTAVLVGCAEKLGGELANSLVAFDSSGSVAGVHRKTALWGEESEGFASGEAMTVVDLAGRRVGLMICYEIEFPELARALAVAGADLLVTCSANMEPYYEDHELSGRARALDNRVPHVYVNRVGSEAGLEFVGGTRAIGADGSPIAVAGEGEEVLVVEVPEPPAHDGG